MGGSEVKWMKRERGTGKVREVAVERVEWSSWDRRRDEARQRGSHMMLREF
jgi:hypothetical protein